VLSGLAYLGLMVHQTEPDFYAPTRTALVSARQHLEDSFSQEAELLGMLQGAHRDLEAAANDLDRAATDPDHRREVKVLRRRLRALEDVERLQHMTPKQLHESYQEIERQLSTLIDRLATQKD
jgi:DNA repair ATPase RecN